MISISKTQRVFRRAIRRHGEKITIIDRGRPLRAVAVVNLYRKPVSHEVYGLMKIYSPGGKSAQIYSLMIEPDMPIYEGTTILRRGVKLTVLAAAGVPAGIFGDAYITALAVPAGEQVDDYNPIGGDTGDDG